MKRKLLTLVLALSMVVAYAMPVFNHGTESYAATSKTVEEAMTWVKNQVGKSIDKDGYPAEQPYQCVDFIMAYYEALGVAHAWGDGKDYATNTLPAGWTRVKGGTPKKGDILVYNTNPYGHVAIYESDYVTYHQNYPSPYVTKYTNRKYNQLVDQAYWGYIRPNWKASAPAVTYTRYLSDDKYFIESGVGNSQYMTVYGHSGKNNVNIQTYNSTMKQDVFAITHLSNGFYKFKNYELGKCVDIEGSNFVSGTNVHQYEDNGNDEQKWGLVKAGDGYFYIRSKANSKLSIDVKDGVAKNGTNIRVCTNNTSKAQKWKFITDGLYVGKTIEPGYYYIKSGVGNGQYVNVKGSNVEINNAKSLNQIFQIEYVKNGYYKIRHYETSKMMDIAGVETVYEGNSVRVSAPDSGRDQNWIIKKVDGGYEIVNRINGYRMDVVNAASTNGTNIGMHYKNGNKAQKYTFEKATMPTGISLDKAKMTLTEGESGQLTATIAPANAVDKRVTWTTSDPSVATVKDGKVTALKTGKVTISAVSMMDQLASCTVTVEAKPMDALKAFGVKANSLGDNKEAKGSTFSILQARAGKVTKKAITIKWNKVYGATGYVIYANKCGTKNKYKKVATIKSGSTKSKKFTKINGKKLKKGTYYKFLVAAVRDGDVIAASKTVHVITAGSKKYANTTGITLKNVKKNKLTLKKGKKFTIKITQKKPAKKSLKKHRKPCYESSNKKVATVSAKGVITAKAKGKAVIYVYAQNGLFKKITVTVK